MKKLIKEEEFKMELIQYYLDMQVELVVFYMNHPLFYILGWLFCALCIATIILGLINDEMVINSIKAYILKTLRE